MLDLHIICNRRKVGHHAALMSIYVGRSVILVPLSLHLGPICLHAIHGNEMYINSRWSELQRELIKRCRLWVVNDTRLRYRWDGIDLQEWWRNVHSISFPYSWWPFWDIHFLPLEIRGNSLKPLHNTKTYNRRNIREAPPWPNRSWNVHSLLILCF